MGRRSISERYIRATGWSWIVVFACAAFAALFAVLVKTTPAEGINAGDILQAAASVAGSALGIIGAFMLARWSLDETRRERQEHRAALAVLASNAILGLMTYYEKLQPEIEQLDRTSEAVTEFGTVYDKFTKPTLEPTPGLRGELVASFPTLENCIEAIGLGNKSFHENLAECRSRIDHESQADNVKIAYRNCIVNLVTICEFMAILGEQRVEAVKLASGKKSFEEEMKIITAFKTSVYDLAKRTAPDVQLG